MGHLNSKESGDSKEAKEPAPKLLHGEDEAKVVFLPHLQSPAELDAYFSYLHHMQDRTVVRDVLENHLSPMYLIPGSPVFNLFCEGDNLQRWVFPLLFQTAKDISHPTEQSLFNQAMVLIVSVHYNQFLGGARWTARPSISDTAKLETSSSFKVETGRLKERRGSAHALGTPKPATTRSITPNPKGAEKKLPPRGKHQRQTSMLHGDVIPEFAEPKVLSNPSSPVVTRSQSRSHHQRASVDGPIVLAGEIGIERTMKWLKDKDWGWGAEATMFGRLVIFSFCTKILNTWSVRESVEHPVWNNIFTVLRVAEAFVFASPLDIHIGQKPNASQLPWLGFHIDDTGFLDSHLVHTVVKMIGHVLRKIKSSVMVDDPSCKEEAKLASRLEVQLSFWAAVDAYFNEVMRLTEVQLMKSEHESSIASASASGAYKPRSSLVLDIQAPGVSTEELKAAQDSYQRAFENLNKQLINHKHEGQNVKRTIPYAKGGPSTDEKQCTRHRTAEKGPGAQREARWHCKLCCLSAS